MKPFHLRINGSVTSEVYNSLVNSLSHPIGYTYVYNQILQEGMSDLFALIETYDVNIIEIRQLNGTFDAFTPDSNDVNVKQSFIDRGYTSEEYDALKLAGTIKVHLNKTVSRITDSFEDDGLHRIILFEDGSVITQMPNPITVTYKNAAGEHIKLFNGHYSIYADYTPVFNISYTDTLIFLDTLNTDLIDNDVFNITTEVTDTLTSSYYSYGGIYLTSTDNFYMVSDDGLDPTNQYYVTGI